MGGNGLKMKKNISFAHYRASNIVASCKSEDTKEQGMLTKNQEVINK